MELKRQKTHSPHDAVIVLIVPFMELKLLKEESGTEIIMS
jgi:hypothetical protein